MNNVIWLENEKNIQAIVSIVNQELFNINISDDDLEYLDAFVCGYEVYSWPRVLIDIHTARSGIEEEIKEQIYIAYNHDRTFSVCKHCTEFSILYDEAVEDYKIIESDLALNKAIKTGCSYYNKLSLMHRN